MGEKTCPRCKGEKKVDCINCYGKGKIYRSFGEALKCVVCDGEGSIRMVMNLTGRKDVPTSAQATNSMGISEAYYVLFPGSVDDLGDRKNWTPARIEKSAAARFKQWGGGSLDVALKRLSACAERYKNLPTIQASIPTP